MTLYRDVSVACLVCAQGLEPIQLRGRDVLQCPGCGGTWIDPPLLESWTHELFGEHGELVEHNDGTPRRPCLTCGEDMAIVWMEYLQLDRCDKHGVWLDAGELPRLLAKDVIPDDVLAVLKRLPAKPKPGA